MTIVRVVLANKLAASSARSATSSSSSTHAYLVKMGQKTQEMGTRPNGAPAATLAVLFPRVDTNAHIKGSCLRRFCRRRYFLSHCSRVILADSPLKTAFFILLATEVIGAHAGGIQVAE